MKQITTADEYKAVRAEIGQRRLGFVPTMGALHRGHESLIKCSLAECDVTVVSIFVNPTQFDNKDDLNNYPMTLDEDTCVAKRLGVDYLLLPAYEDLYPDGFRYQIDETEFSKELCGACREGHFTGVLTIVMKLLNLVKPHRAYFGAKDYQQYQLIKDMVSAFLMDVAVIACPTVREQDGLALSSRNLNLDAGSRVKAPLLYKLLISDEPDSVVAGRLADAGFDVDYVVTRDGRRYGAARLGRGAHRVRLIDNVPLESTLENRQGKT